MTKLPSKHIVILLALSLGFAALECFAETAKPSQDEFVVPDYKLLTLNDELKDLLDREVKPLATKKQRLTRLHDIFYQPYYYNIRYEASGTLTAVDTFYTGRGNCISLANLLIAAARYVGLNAKYQKVRVEREWRPKDGFYEIPGHINVVVNLHRERAEIEFNRAFFENKDQHRIVRRTISDKQAKAEFLNNIGVEMLDKQDYMKAIAYFKAATQTYGKLDFAHSNLGVAYKQRGDYKKAELSYLKALDINSRNQSTIGNIYILYKEIGEHDKAQVYARRAEKYARKNPYYLQQLANSEIEKKNYQAAIKLLKKAIKVFDLEPNFYHDLAIAYYLEHDLERSRQALEKAKAVSRSADYKNRYQRKIDALVSSSIGSGDMASAHKGEESAQ